MRSIIGLSLAFLHIPAAATAAEPEASVTTYAQPLPDSRVPSGFITDIDVQDSFLDGKGVADRLTGVAGVSLQRRSSLGQPVFARVRGGNPRQITVSLDGYKLSAPFGAGFDLGGLAFSGVEQVRVYRGAAAAVHGAGALTGALELRTSVRKAAGSTTTGSLLGGSFKTAGLTVSGDHSDDGFSVRVSGQARQSAGDFEFTDAQGVDHTRMNNSHRRAGVTVTAERRFSSTSKGRVTAIWDGGTRGAPGPSEFQERLSRAKIEDQRFVSTGRVDHQDSLRVASFSVDTHQQIGAQWRTTRYLNPASLVGNSSVVNTSEYGSFSGAAGAVGFSGNLSVRLEYEGTHSAYDAREAGAQPLLAEIHANRTQNVIVAATEYAADSWSLMLGVRTEFMTGSRDELAALPSLGGVWTPTPWFSVRSNLARTYRPPDFDELYLDLETIRGNPDLDSERSWSADIGPELSFAKWRMGAAYFENRMESVILFLPVSSTVIEASNIAGATSRGVETWAGLDLLDNISLTANYTFTRARRDEASEQLPHQAVHEGRIGARFLPAPWVALSGEVHGHSALNLDSFGNLEAPGWLAVDSSVHLHPSDSLNIGVSAQNLLNNLSRVDSLQQPLPGRSVYVSVQIMEAL